MVLIITSFGPTDKYPDQAMMRRTFGAFLHSLRRQTDRNFRLFISYHDKPGGITGGCDDPWIEWCCVAADGSDHTLIPAKLSELVMDCCEMKTVSFGSKGDDCGRKRVNSMMVAGRWAWENKLADFWMLRMDSDDLLWEGMVAALNSIPPDKARAIWNRLCHIYDPRRDELGIYRYGHGTNCNAIRLRFEGKRLPNWFIHDDDHTMFRRRLHNKDIVGMEIGYTMCVVTNSGNSISERPEIAKEKYAEKIPMDKAVMSRYGLDFFTRNV